MWIGELSDRTGTPRRLLRYYEEQQLITSDRAPNGYRDYDDHLVDRVLQIRALLNTGLPTRLIRQILPRLPQAHAIHPVHATPELIATLEHEHRRITRRIQHLTDNANAMAHYLATLRSSPTHPEAPGSRTAACESSPTRPMNPTGPDS
ncbi:MerR family transcriptional regulator [Streptomyces sp. URMC 124]|uniref:MerR family transcriptional regulator n=1 Tax=Streptomyces sp. URMC 124 TaxID=3423405 RepID=UPI003F1D3634